MLTSPPVSAATVCASPYRSFSPASGSSARSPVADCAGSALQQAADGGQDELGPRLRMDRDQGDAGTASAAARELGRQPLGGHRPRPQAPRRRSASRANHVLGSGAETPIRTHPGHRPVASARSEIGVLQQRDRADATPGPAGAATTAVATVAPSACSSTSNDTPVGGRRTTCSSASVLPHGALVDRTTDRRRSLSDRTTTARAAMPLTGLPNHPAEHWPPAAASLEGSRPWTPSPRFPSR